MMLSGYISPGTQFRIPGSTIKTTFQTDSSVTRADRSTTKKGFRLRFGKAGSGCSKFVYVTSKVKIKSPRFSKPHPANKQCEYRLKVAPLSSLVARCGFWTPNSEQPWIQKNQRQEENSRDE
ncbi:uncharacterized protein [Macrobrachium rosenbergii]|uniref:uncharacterized protein isoform X2 n=1 Tax=Macrobrachium rosenbergii TaxID=79674 RepID=UPI0034D61650